MKRAKIENLTTEELVAQFSDLALDQHEAVETFQTARYNRLYDRMMLVKKELKARDGDHRRALIPLLASPNIQVRFMAAYALLTIVPDQVRTVLEGIRASGRSPQCIDAGYTLDRFEESITKFVQFDADGI
jgi:hypothetical protein